MVGRLVWLKAKLLWNGLRADRQRRIGLPLILFFIGWGAIALARRFVETAATLPEGAMLEFAAWVSVAVFAAWVALPVLVFPLDENLDPARFGLTPLDGPRLVMGLAASSLVAPSVVVLAVFAVANIVVLAGGVATLAVLVGTILVVAEMVVAGQVFTTLVSAVMRTRRGRDVAMLVVLGLGLGVFAAQLAVTRAVAASGLTEALAASPLRVWALAIPPLAAQSVGLFAREGAWAFSAAALAVSAGWLLALAGLWRRLLDWMLTTPGRSPAPARYARSSGLTGRLGWGSRRVLARKELRFYLRDPRQRLVWTGAVIFVGLAAASILVGTGGISAFRLKAWLPLISPGLVLFVGLPVALNQFGWERNAVSYLFVLPIVPRKMIQGKNLATTIALLAETAVMAVILAWLSGGWDVLPLVPALAVCAIGCQLAVGNMTSVLTPLRLPREGTDVFAQATEQGCLAIGSQLVSFFIIGLLLVLPASVTVLTVAFGQPVPRWFAAGFASVWGLGLYAVSLWLSGWLLRRRMPEVLGWVQVV